MIVQKHQMLDTRRWREAYLMFERKNASLNPGELYGLSQGLDAMVAPLSRPFSR